jgi:hypothetical protein
MSKEKLKFARGKPFPVEVCDALRELVGRKSVAQQNRENAFADRDAALSEKAKLKNPKSPEYAAASIMHSDAEERIKQLQHDIRYFEKEIDKIIGTPDSLDQMQLNLSFDPPPMEKPKKDEEQLEFGEGEKKVKAVGKPGPVKPDAPDPNAGTGVKQHLSADIKELDLSDVLIKKLRGEGITTVGQLRSANESPGESLQHMFGITDDQANQIGKALGAYLKKHDKADAEADRDAEGITKRVMRMGRGNIDPHASDGPRVMRSLPRVGKGATKTKGRKVSRRNK